MKQQIAMQQLLNQLREEREKLPLLKEWDRCYQAIEMVIEHTYIQIEKEQIAQAWEDGNYNYFHSKNNGVDFEHGLEYYREKYGTN